jgi:solute carrier family 25 (mitochondrial citrate transporter), member 1
MGGIPGEKPKNHLKHLVSGGLTGAIECCITYPTEFIKTKMQLNPEYAKMGVIGSFKDTVKADGVKGLYRGLSVLVALSAPKTGVRFYSKSTYDSVLEVITFV